MSSVFCCTICNSISLFPSRPIPHHPTSSHLSHHTYIFISLGFTQTNGKAERVIRTLMEMWHEKQLFDSPEHRRKELCRFVNFYNTVKPHRSLNGDTPFEVLQAYFSQPVV